MKTKVPILRFKDESGQDYPEWEEKKLGDICIVTMGQSPNSDEYNIEFKGIPLIQGNADIYKRKTLPKLYTNHITKVCNEGEILLSVRAPVGNIAISDRKCCIGRGMCSLSVLNENNQYIYHLMINQESKWGKISQGSTFESINKNDIKNLKINLPSLEEQTKIGNFFSNLDEIIERLDKKVEDLESFKKGLVERIFNQELRFKDENGEDYPNWEEKKLRDVLTIPVKIKSTNPDRNKLITVKLNRKGVTINTNVSTLNIGSTAYFIRKSGQFIYGKQNFFNGAFGIIPDKLNNYLSSGDVPALDINKYIILPIYLLNFLGRKSFYKNTKNLSNGTGSKRIHEDTLLNINITLPNLKEQTKIANILSNLDEIIEKESKKLDCFREFKKGLMQRMFV